MWVSEWLYMWVRRKRTTVICPESERDVKKNQGWRIWLYYWGLFQLQVTEIKLTDNSFIKGQFDDLWKTRLRDFSYKWIQRSKQPDEVSVFLFISWSAFLCSNLNLRQPCGYPQKLQTYLILLNSNPREKITYFPIVSTKILGLSLNRLIWVTQLPLN